MTRCSTKKRVPLNAEDAEKKTKRTQRRMNSSSALSALKGNGMDVEKPVGQVASSLASVRAATRMCSSMAMRAPSASRARMA